MDLASVKELVEGACRDFLVRAQSKIDIGHHGRVL